MRSPVILAAFVLASVAAGPAPALAQDFSITNTVEPNPGRRDLMRQLQAWWDLHAYYPRHASLNDEGGTVKLRLLIYPDGRIWTAEVAESSGSGALDAAAAAAFRGGFVHRLPAGTPDTSLDISVHYILAHRHDQPVEAGYAASPARRPFTITNDPVKSPILETMLQRTCTGKVVKQGIRNNPIYGVPYSAEAVFFRRPDGTPWVKFYEGGYAILAPVVEVGKLVQWTGREERLKGGATQSYQYTVWPEGENGLSGNIGVAIADDPDSINHGGTVDLTCATETVPAIRFNAMYVNSVKTPPGDPP